ncbi:helix-turn-helix transcriptional regulator [bacterium]|nr:helix-turn-helix transcriptional regulator [bacterium]
MQDVYIENKQKLQNAIANIIREHRLKSKKSISLLSNEIGMTKSMWADLEKSIKDPQLSTLWRIAEGLEIPLSSIVKELEKSLGKNFSLIN